MNFDIAAHDVGVVEKVSTVHRVFLRPMRVCHDLGVAAVSLAVITFLCGLKDPITRRVGVLFRRSTYQYSRGSPCRLRRRVQCGTRLGSVGTTVPGNVLPDVVYTPC